VAKGFEDRIVYEVELKRPPDEPRKKFLSLLAQTVFDRVIHGSHKQISHVATVFGEAAGSGDIQAWFADPRREALLADSVWAGRLPSPKKDFLMLVDANLTASKANAGLTRDVTYRVDRDRRGHLIATLDIRYTNAGEATHLNPYYNGFLRIYTPLGTRLLDPESARDDFRAKDGPYHVFSLQLYVEPHGFYRAKLVYQLPGSVAPHSDYGTAVIGGVASRLDSSQRRFDAAHKMPRNRILEFVRTLRR